jgi:hypothetical protein
MKKVSFYKALNNYCTFKLFFKKTIFFKKLQISFYLDVFMVLLCPKSSFCLILYV